MSDLPALTGGRPALHAPRVQAALQSARGSRVDTTTGGFKLPAFPSQTCLGGAPEWIPLDYSPAQLCALPLRAMRPSLSDPRSPSASHPRPPTHCYWLAVSHSPSSATACRCFPHLSESVHLQGHPPPLGGLPRSLLVEPVAIRPPSAVRTVCTPPTSPSCAPWRFEQYVFVVPALSKESSSIDKCRNKQ